ncbi:unnamed protein product, partial [Brassica rapa subsp. narinosa]
MLGNLDGAKLPYLREQSLSTCGHYLEINQKRKGMDGSPTKLAPTPPLGQSQMNTIPAGTTCMISCCSDAAWQATTNRAGCGWIFTDHRDERLLQGTATFDHTVSPLMAEALAVRSALLHALEAGYSRICLKPDCQALVAIITSTHHPTELYGITRNIEHLSLSFDCIVFTFIPRNLNVMAD